MPVWIMQARFCVCERVSVKCAVAVDEEVQIILLC